MSHDQKILLKYNNEQLQSSVFCRHYAVGYIGHANSTQARDKATDPFDPKDAAEEALEHILETIRVVEPENHSSYLCLLP